MQGIPWILPLRVCHKNIDARFFGWPSFTEAQYYIFISGLTSIHISAFKKTCHKCSSKALVAIRNHSLHCNHSLQLPTNENGCKLRKVVANCNEWLLTVTCDDHSRQFFFESCNMFISRPGEKGTSIEFLYLENLYIFEA